MNAVATAPAPAGAGAPRVRRLRVTWVALVSLALLVAGLFWSLSLGSQRIGLAVILTALLGGGPQELIVRTIRLPRALLSATVGGNMAIAGVVMQGVTGNPLAAPEILGVSAGAAIAVIAWITLFPSLVGPSVVLVAMLGAAAAGLTVLVLAGMGRGRTGNVRLALAGVTVTTLLLSTTQGLVIFHENSTEAVFFWLVGGVNFAQWSDITTVLPWAVVGMLGAFAMAGSLNLLAVGEDVARGLGQRVELVRAAGAVLVIVLAGASVAVAGPIVFIGLVVPHIVRRLVGNNHAVVLPLSALVGAVLLMYADIGSRYVNPPYEVPAGVVTALIGAPFFVYLARKQKVTS